MSSLLQMAILDITLVELFILLKDVFSSLQQGIVWTESLIHLLNLSDSSEMFSTLTLRCKLDHELTIIAYFVGSPCVLVQ